MFNLTSAGNKVNLWEFFMIEIWCAFWLQFDWYVDWAYKRSRKKWYRKDHPETDIRTLRWKFVWDFFILSMKVFFRSKWNFTKALIKEVFKKESYKNSFYFEIDRNPRAEGIKIKLCVWVFCVDISLNNILADSDYTDDRNEYLVSDGDVYNEPNRYYGIRFWITSYRVWKHLGDRDHHQTVFSFYTTDRLYQKNPFRMFKKNPITRWLKKIRVEQEMYDTNEIYNQICSDPMNGCPEDFAEDGDRKINHLMGVYHSL